LGERRIKKDGRGRGHSLLEEGQRGEERAKRIGGSSLMHFRTARGGRSERVRKIGDRKRETEEDERKGTKKKSSRCHGRIKD